MKGSNALPRSRSANSLPANRSTCTGTHKITQEDLNVGFFNDVANASSKEAEAPPAEDTIKAEQKPKLGVTKTDNLNPAKYNKVGQVVKYTLTATNEGNITLHNVTVSDTPALEGFSCIPAIPVGELAPGKSIVCTGTHTITQEDLNNGSFKDTANASSKEAEAPPAEDTIKAEQKPKLGRDQDRQPEPGEVQQSRSGREIHPDGDQRRQHHAAQRDGQRHAGA